MMGARMALAIAPRRSVWSVSDIATPTDKGAEGTENALVYGKGAASLQTETVAQRIGGSAEKGVCQSKRPGERTAGGASGDDVVMHGGFVVGGGA